MAPRGVTQRGRLGVAFTSDLAVQGYNLGYDASENAVPKAGYAIHHPAGNFARISSYNQTS